MPNSTKKKEPIPEPSSSSESELMIDENQKKRSPVKRGSSQKRRRKRSKTGSGEEQFDVEIEKTIKSCMKKNSDVLNSDAVKKIIRKLILNEHVLAVVKLKEEELQKRANDKGSEADDEDDEVVLKLTRSKAKELEQGLLPLMPLKSTEQADSETLKLLAADLHDDSDTDQSYKPDDDEHNTTVSDFDSMPSTPIVQRPEPSPEVRYTEDGQFKIPRIRNESVTTSEAEEEPIIKRTRSKLCYKTTHIEDLESTLIAPDITTDLYEMDYEIDEYWAEFLTQFSKPLNLNAEDEDDTDPEFTPIDEGVDAEELKDVAIPKKEYNLLLKELSTMVDESQLCDEFEMPQIGSPERETERRLRSPRSVRRKSNVKETETSNKEIELHTPTPQQDSLFQPDLMSTIIATTPDATMPADSIEKTAIAEPIVISQNDATSLPIMTGSILIQTVEGGEPIKIDNVNLISGGNFENGMLVVPQYQEFLIKIPTEDLLKNSTNSINTTVSTAPSFSVQNCISDYSYSDSVGTNKSCSCEGNLLQESSTKTQPNRHYDIVKLDEPPRVKLSNTDTKFLPEQIKILEQQMRIFVQFSIQGFLQTYAHPVHWKHASNYETSLRELSSKIYSPLSAFNAVNLQPALELIENWKAKREYKDGVEDEVVAWFLKQQNRISDSKRSIRVGLNPLIMHEMLHSPAFLYSQYLPTTGFKFRASQNFRAPFTVGEEVLIAYGLEKFENEKKNTPKVNNKPAVSLQEVCDKIAKQILHGCRTANGLYGQVFQWKSASSPMNAVKYYKIYSKAPDFIHKIIPFEVGRQLVERKEELPEMFQNFLTTAKNPKKINRKQSSCASKNKENTSTDLNQNTEVASGLQVRIDINYETVQSSPNNYSIDKQVEQESIDEEDIPLQHRIKKTPKKKSSRKSLSFDKSEQKSRSDSLLKSKAFIDRKNKAVNVLEQLSQAIPVSFDKEVLPKIRHNAILLQIFNHLKTFHAYAEMSNGPTGVRKLYPDITDDNKPTRKLNDDKPIVEHNNKKKSVENLDQVAATKYIEKVEEVLVGANKPDEYEKFIDTLKTFDPEKERVADLYYKMEKIFYPHHSELLSLFLTFLLPGQAMEVGKFFDHFMLTNMTTFLSKLNIYFAKQPSQIRKIMNCLSELSTVEDVTLETVKESILPLLKGNPLLIDWFQQMFPNEKPIDCNDGDCEVIRSNLNDPITSTSEVYEEVVLADMPQSAEQPSCGLKYGQGGISYAGRMCVLPGKLSFMPYDAVTSTSTIKKSSCSHAIKEYADAKLQEKSKPCADVHSTTQENDQAEEVIDDGVSTDEEPIKVVDENVLKAHAIRLNPVVHSSKGETYADISSLLVTPPSNAEKYFSDDTKSPKKNTTVTRTTKKSNLTSPKQSTSKLIKSPPPSTSGANTSKRLGATNVLAKAKKLKLLIDSDSEVEVGSKEKKSKPSKIKKITPSLSVAPMVVEPELNLASKLETNITVADKKDETVPTVVNWTREEDKIILEEERNGYESFTELLGRLKNHLPNRTESDITSRYEFLMEILRKIQGNG